MMNPMQRTQETFAMIWETCFSHSISSKAGGQVHLSIPSGLSGSFLGFTV